MTFFANNTTQHDANYNDLGFQPSNKCPTADPSGCHYSSPHDMRIWLQYAMGLVTPPGSYGAARNLMREDRVRTNITGVGQGIGWTIVDTDKAAGPYPNACDKLPSPETLPNKTTRTFYNRVTKGGDSVGSHSFIEFLQDPANPNAVAPLGVVLLANSDLNGEKSLGQLSEDLLARLKLTQP